MTFYVVHNTGYHMIRIGHIKKKTRTIQPDGRIVQFCLCFGPFGQEIIKYQIFTNT
jgi:hypothetical protein